MNLPNILVVIPKVVYYIESNTLSNKHIRYFLFLRKKGYDVNQIMDRIIADEEIDIDGKGLELSVIPK